MNLDKLSKILKKINPDFPSFDKFLAKQGEEFKANPPLGEWRHGVLYVKASEVVKTFDEIAGVFESKKKSAFLGEMIREIARNRFTHKGKTEQKGTT